MTKLELKRARKKLGLSQQAAADLIGTKLRTWQDWEYGVTPIPGPVSALMRLLLHYKSAAGFLYGRDT